MRNQTPSHISEDCYLIYKNSKFQDSPLKSRFINDIYNENFTKNSEDFRIIQSTATIYAGEIAALDELENLANEEISNGPANPLVLADLLDQAIAIAEEINENNVKSTLTEAIHEAKAVSEAIYDGTIDDFGIPDSDENISAFGEEFEALKIAILSIKNKMQKYNV